MRFDGLIFDLDGTLWDCSKASAEAFNRAFETCGLTKRISDDVVRSVSGKPADECVQILLSDVPYEKCQSLSQALDRFELDSIEKHAPTALYADVCAGLHKLKSHYTLAVVSNCTESYLKLFERCTPVANLFADSECFGRTNRPKSENIRAVIERQKLRSACYIGDTAGDEEAAMRAGIPFFHASYGFGKPRGEPIAFASFSELVGHFVTLAPDYASA
jgi:phosphoglycolate phosphatase